jgi:transposase-like protein
MFGLSGIDDSILSIYPNAQFQQCCVHVSRNIAHKVRVKDRKEKSVVILKLSIKRLQKRKQLNK